MRRGITMLCLGLSLCAPPAVAIAQDGAAAESGTERTPDEREAQMRFELGRRYYETGRFLEAAREFEAAIEIAPLPALYFNLFLALRDGGEDERAATTLRVYIGTLEPGDRRMQLEARLRVLERGGEDDDRDDDDGAHSVGSAAPASTARSGSDGDSDPAPWIVVGAGGLLVVGAVVTGILATGERAALDDLCPTPDTCPDGFEETQSRGEALAITTDVLWITGAAAITAGIVWAIVGASGDDSSPRAGLACDEHGCLATLRGEF